MTWADRRYDFEDGPRAPLKPGAVTKGIIATCAGIWLLEMMAGPSGIVRFEYYLALDPRALVKHFFVWQPFTYMFLHSTNGIFHILFNMLCLYFIGPSVEAAIGPKRFAHLFVWGGVAGGLAQCFFMPRNPVVGASAAIMAVLVVFAAFYPNAQFLFMFVFPMKAKHLVLLFIAIDLYRGYVGSSGIASFAHLGGALFGFLFLKFGPLAQNVTAQWARTKRQKHQMRTEDQRARVDEILDKINSSGMGSLTKRERAFLMEASRNYRDRTGL